MSLLLQPFLVGLYTINPYKETKIVDFSLKELALAALNS